MGATEASSRRKTKSELKGRIKNGYRTLDPHKELYNKEAREVEYTDQNCMMCGSRIDENGMCACGAGDS